MRGAHPHTSCCEIPTLPSSLFFCSSPCICHAQLLPRGACGARLPPAADAGAGRSNDLSPDEVFLPSQPQLSLSERKHVFFLLLLLFPLGLKEISWHKTRGMRKGRQRDGLSLLLFGIGLRLIGISYAFFHVSTHTPSNSHPAQI